MTRCFHRRGVALALFAAAFALVAAIAAPAFASGSLVATGSGSQAFGVSSAASVATGADVVAAKFGVTTAEESAAEEEASASLSETSSRTPYEVKALGPTDAGEAAGVCMEDGTVVVKEDQGWRLGSASAYTLADNDGYDATASGVSLAEDGMTVAVPANRTDLLGRTVEIYYNGTTVTATVTDTGGFASYGRDLDLAGGVWRALGASTGDEWGVRTVAYRFL